MFIYFDSFYYRKKAKKNYVFSTSMSHKTHYTIRSHKTHYTIMSHKTHYTI